MILTDGKHLMSDSSLRELHDFAINKLRFKKEWFQDDKLHPHYDLLTEGVRARAYEFGAIKVSPKELVLRCSRRYNR